MIYFYVYLPVVPRCRVCPRMHTSRVSCGMKNATILIAFFKKVNNAGKGSGRGRKAGIFKVRVGHYKSPYLNTLPLCSFPCTGRCRKPCSICATKPHTTYSSWSPAISAFELSFRCSQEQVLYHLPRRGIKIAQTSILLR